MFSGALLRLFDDIAPLTFDQPRGRSYSADPVISDLCGPCNHGLSPCDTGIATLAQSHLKFPVIRTLTPAVEPSLVKLWVVKTSANLTRSGLSPSFWWHAYRDYFRGLANAGNCDVLFANWRDYSPIEIASELNVVMSIHAQEARIFGLECGSSRVIQQHLVHAQAIKVGYGIFLLLVWQPAVPAALRANVIVELNRYGWLGLADPYWLARVAFNITSCAAFNLVADPAFSLPTVLQADEARRP